jgi:membrane-associated phospholipid phosphatase
VSSSASYYVWQPPAFVNQYAAMPSLHFAWNVLVTAALVRNLQSRWRHAALLMPAAIGAAAVFSADHFFLDLAAGAVVAFLGLWLAGRLRASLPRSPPFSYLT